MVQYSAKGYLQGARKMLERFLRMLEGTNPKCILCGRREAKQSIVCSGVGVCSSCFGKYMEKCVKDYYDIGGGVRRLFAPFAYDDDIRRVLLELKFGGCYAYAEPIAKLVTAALPPYYLYSDYDLIVPVPLHPRRLADRGYNQAELIAKVIAEELGVGMKEDVLFRTRATMHQMNLSRSLRELNVKDAFFADEKSVSGKRILLVDDIFTVGATVRSCASELLAKGAMEVSAIAVCTNFGRNEQSINRITIPTVKD